MFKKLLGMIPVFKELKLAQEKNWFLFKGIKKIKNLLKNLDAKDKNVKEIRNVCNELIKGVSL